MTALRGASAFLHRTPRLRLGMLLSAPLLWLGLAYLSALAALFLTAFWHTDPFTGKVITDWSLDNFETLVTDSVYRTITFRTVGGCTRCSLPSCRSQCHAPPRRGRGGSS